MLTTRFILGFLLIAAGVVMMAWDKRAGRRRDAFAHWDDVPGRIVTAKVVRVGEAVGPSGEAAPLWSAEVAYRYTVGGLEYQGTQRRFGKFSVGEFARAETIVAAFPANAPVEVAVDPADPTSAVLPYAPPNRVLFGLGLATTVIGALVLMAVR